MASDNRISLQITDRGRPEGHDHASKFRQRVGGSGVLSEREASGEKGRGWVRDHLRRSEDSVPRTTSQGGFNPAANDV